MAKENEETNEFGEALNTEEPEQKTDIQGFSEEMDTVLKKPAGEVEVASKEVTGDEIPDETTAEVGDSAAAEKTEIEGQEVLDGIDPEVLEACREYGWDDDKIAKIAELSPDLLDDVRDVLNEEESELVEEKKVEPEEKESDELKFNLDPDVVGSDVANAISKMASVLNEQRKGLSAEKGELQSERDAAFNVRIDDCFDKFTKDVPEIGKSSKLNRRQGEMRSELFAHAGITARMRRIPIERAIQIEVTKYRSQDDKAAQQKLLNKLNKQEGRMTNKPTRRHSNLKSRKFASEEEMKETLMTEAYKEAGIEG